MAYRDLLQSNLETFVQKARDRGLTDDEILSIVKAAKEEIIRFNRAPYGRGLKVSDVLRKHYIKVMESRGEETKQH